MGVSSLMVSYIVEPPTNAVKVYHRQFQLSWWWWGIGNNQIYSSVKSLTPDFILHRQHIYGLRIVPRVFTHWNPSSLVAVSAVCMSASRSRCYWSCSMSTAFFMLVGGSHLLYNLLIFGLSYTKTIQQIYPEVGFSFLTAEIRPYIWEYLKLNRKLTHQCDHWPNYCDRYILAVLSDLCQLFLAASPTFCWSV